jgi:hypothetical protein
MWSASMTAKNLIIPCAEVSCVLGDVTIKSPSFKKNQVHGMQYPMPVNKTDKGSPGFATNRRRQSLYLFQL